MPTSSSNGNTPHQGQSRSPRWTLDQQRTRRSVDLSDAKQRQSANEVEADVLRGLNRLITSGRRVRDAQIRVDILEESDNQYQLNQPTRTGGLLMNSLAGFVTVIGAAVVDFTLLAGSAHELIQQVYRREGGPPLWAVALVPTSVLALELGIAARLVTLQPRNGVVEPEDRNALRSLRLLGVLLALVAPCLGIAPYLANPEQTGTVQLLLMAGVVALGIVTHSLTIFGGRWILPALEWIVGLPAAWWRTREIRREAEVVQQHRDATLDALHRYEHALDGYRRTTGRVPPQSLLIPAREAAMVNEAVGSVVVDVLGEGPSDDPPPAAPPSPAPRGGQTPPSTAASSAAMPEQEMPAPGGGSAGDADYFRAIVEARIRDADGQVA